MISVYQLKSKFSDILRPLIKFMVKLGITANMVTISAFILSVAVGADGGSYIGGLGAWRW